MHILLTTYGLLMIMALFAYAQWKNAESLVATDMVARCRFAKAREKTSALLVKQVKKLHSDYIEEKAPKGGKEESEVEDEEEDGEGLVEILLPDGVENENDKTDKKKGKRSHLLDVSILFRDKNASIVDGKGKVAYMILKNLIESLYAKQPFYEEVKQKDPDFAEHFIDWLMLKARAELEEKRPLKKAKDLSMIDLEDPSLKEARYKIFNGNQSINDPGVNAGGYYPLYELISLQKKSHLVSFWLAPKPLLYAVFQNPDVVTEMCELRDGMYKEKKSMARSEKNEMKSADDIQKQKLEQCFKSHPTEFIDSQYFDFGTSGTKPPRR
ncbi:MAG: hypothetical protein JSR46_01075 [Verrucomicrobia bacterium]|nr:hypothetical protein [Verrucomicrobiota bacterium]